MEDKNLELYKIFNKKVDEEIKEFYVLNSAFLILMGFILSLTGNEKIPEYLNVIIILSGFLISIFWRLAMEGQKTWKNFWINKLIHIEEYLEKENYSESNIWEWLKDRSKNDKDFIGDLNKLEVGHKGIWQELKGKRRGFGVTKYIRYIPVLFLYIWLIIFIFKFLIQI